MTKITPTVGRIVLFRSESPMHHAREEVPAIITGLQSGGSVVDLTIFPPNRPPLALTSVGHGEPDAGLSASWRWMPYQKEVAGKTEQLLAANQVAPQVNVPRDAVLAAQDADAAAVAKTSNRVTLDDIEGLIAHTLYLTAGPGGLLTICVLTLRSGFTVTGESACADPANFDAELGRKIARRNAVEKIWPLKGYRLRNRLADAQAVDRVVDLERIARTTHAVNRAWCEYLGDDSQPAWEDAPAWQKDSALDGVRFHLANPGADDSASHDNWLAQKQADGWAWGPVKNPEAKLHPCCVPFDALPRDQRFKDRLFRTVVHAAA